MGGEDGGGGRGEAGLRGGGGERVLRGEWGKGCLWV